MTSIIELRDYQSQIITDTRQSLRQYGDTLIQLPTGGGKTAIAVYILGSTCQRGKKGWFICHRSELIYQTSLTFQRFGIPHSFIAAGMEYNPDAAIHIISVDTLKNRIHELELPDIAVWDESHHIVAPGWLAVKQMMQRTLHIGLTATPELLSGQGMGEAFANMVQGPTPRELISRGYLSAYEYWGPTKPELSDHNAVNGDFKPSDMAALMAKPTIQGDILRSWQEKAGNRISIGFAPNRATSQMFAERFNKAGIPSMHIDGTTKPEIRKRAAQLLASGDLLMLWNVELMSEGYDLSAQAGTDVTIDCLIDASPTRSLAKFLQRCGRVLRPKTDGSEAVIIDCSGNYERHGLPSTDREWSLDAKARGSRAANDNVAIRQCEQCYFVHEPAPVCPNCGHQHPVKVRVVKEATDTELKRIEAEEHQKKMMELNSRVRLCRTFDDFKALAADMGYSPGWAWHRYNARKGKRAG